jgi:hypothetical protein
MYYFLNKSCETNPSHKNEKDKTIPLEDFIKVVTGGSNDAHITNNSSPISISQ